MYHRLELLAAEPFRGRYHQHVPIDQDNDDEERIRCRTVGTFCPLWYSLTLVL